MDPGQKGQAITLTSFVELERSKEKFTIYIYIIYLF